MEKDVPGDPESDGEPEAAATPGDPESDGEPGDPESGTEPEAAEDGAEVPASGGEAGPLFDPRFSFLLAGLSGLLYFLGVPGPDLWPFALIAQVPLILVLRGQTPARAAALGFAAGLTLSATLFYWLFSTLQVFGHFSAPIAAIFVMLLWSYQAGRVALLGWLYARAERRGWPAAPVFVLALVSTELAYPLLFPWFYAITVAGQPLLYQTADLAGPCLVSVVLLGSNLAIAELVAARLERRRFARGLVAVGFALPVLGVVYGLVRMRQIDAIAAAAPSLRVGIAQGNQPLVGRNASVVTSRRLTQTLRDRGADLVVWSEGSVPDVFPEETYELDARRRITGRLGVPVIIGGGVMRGTGEGRREFNTAMLAGADGVVIGRYDKQYLLPFGEYLPLDETFPSLRASLPNAGRLSPGDSLEPMIWDGHRIATLICYEDVLPRYVNRLVRHAKPDLLVNLTIDTWFGDTLEPWQHLGIARMRAVEHRRWLVRATNSGVSAIVDAAGRVTMHGETFKEEALLGEVRLVRGTTLYEIIGDVPFYAGALAMVAMAFVRRRRNGGG